MASSDRTAQPVPRFKAPGPTGAAQPWMNRAPPWTARPGLVSQYPGSRSFPGLTSKATAD